MYPMLSFLNTLASPYLVEFWWALGLWVAGSYGIAFLLSRIVSVEPFTIIYRCRQAWSISFAVHALITLGLYVVWYLKFARDGLFDGFWLYSAPYIGLFIVDIVLWAALMVSQRRFEQY